MIVKKKVKKRRESRNEKLMMTLIRKTFYCLNINVILRFIVVLMYEKTDTYLTYCRRFPR